VVVQWCNAEQFCEDYFVEDVLDEKWIVGDIEGRADAKEALQYGSFRSSRGMGRALLYRAA
jgi:hypothetical protein